MLLFNVRLRNLTWAIIVLVALIAIGFDAVAFLTVFYGVFFWWGVRSTHTTPFARPFMAWMILPAMVLLSKGNVPAVMFYMALLYMAMRFALRYANFDAMVSGIIGEQDVEDALELCRKRLARDDQTIFIRNNVLLRRLDGSTVEIDHVIVGGDWLYVVETKSIRGTVGYDASSNSLYRNEDYLRPNPLSQLRHQVSMLRAQMPEVTVYSVVCFTEASAGYSAENAPHVIFGVQGLQDDVLRVAWERDVSSYAAASDLNHRLAGLDVSSEAERDAHADRVFAKHGSDSSPSPARQRMAIKIAAVLSVIVTVLGSAGITASLAPSSTINARFSHSLESVKDTNSAVLSRRAGGPSETWNSKNPWH